MNGRWQVWKYTLDTDLPWIVWDPDNERQGRFDTHKEAIAYAHSQARKEKTEEKD